MHWCTQPANINVSIRSFVRLTQDVLSYTNKIAGVVENGYAAVPFFVVETDAQAVQAVERPAGGRRDGVRRARALGVASNFAMPTILQLPLILPGFGISLHLVPT